MSYGYDLAGNMTSETYPSGRTVTTGFDGAGRVSAVNGQKTAERPKYIEAFFSNIDWTAVERRLKYGKQEKAIVTR